MESRSNENETTNVLTNTRPKEEGERTKKKSEKADCEARSKADPKTKADRNPRCGSRAVPSSVQIQSWFCYSAPISFNGLPFSLGRGRRAWPPQGAWSAGVRRRGRRCWRGGDWASTCCAAARRRTRRRATAASASPAPWPPPSRRDRRRRRRRRRRRPRRRRRRSRPAPAASEVGRTATRRRRRRRRWSSRPWPPSRRRWPRWPPSGRATHCRWWNQTDNSVKLGNTVHRRSE